MLIAHADSSNGRKRLGWRDIHRGKKKQKQGRSFPNLHGPAAPLGKPKAQQRLQASLTSAAGSTCFETIMVQSNKSFLKNYAHKCKLIRLLYIILYSKEYFEYLIFEFSLVKK